MGQHPWHHMAFFSVTVRSSIDPLSLELVWIELDNLIFLLYIIYFVRLRNMAMLLGHPQDLQKKRVRKIKKRKKILYGDLGHYEGASYEIVEKTSAGSPRHPLSK